MKWWYLTALLATALAAPLTVDPGTSNANALEALFKAGTESIETQDLKASVIQTTYNELQEGRCADAIVIYARGTTEIGNVGIIVSPKLFAELKNVLGSRVIFQGVNDYAADIPGYLVGGSPSGANNMVLLNQFAALQCPNSKIFNMGYSQGAQVAHRAAATIPTSVYPRIGGFVLIGDPYENRPLPGTLNNNVLTICNDGDPVCDGIPLPIGPHLTYGLRAPEVASWVAQRV